MFEADVLLKADILLKWNQVQDDWQTSWSPIKFMILLSRVSIDVLEDKSVEFLQSSLQQDDRGDSPQNQPGQSISGVPPLREKNHAHQVV